MSIFPYVTVSVCVCCMTFYPSLSFSASICLCSLSYDAVASVVTLTPYHKLIHFTVLHRGAKLSYSRL